MYGEPSKAPPSAARPLPEITPLNERFWELAARSVFSIQTCRACGDRHIPESPVCPACLSEDQEWEPASGTGTVESWVDFHRAYWDGFVQDLPYRVCLVRLAEGPLYIARLLGDPERVRMGAKARIVFEPASETISVPCFTIAD
jgi:uncharacterized OB-fold protein